MTVKPLLHTKWGNSADVVNDLRSCSPALLHQLFVLVRTNLQQNYLDRPSQEQYREIDARDDSKQPGSFQGNNNSCSEPRHLLKYCAQMYTSSLWRGKEEVEEEVEKVEEKVEVEEEVEKVEEKVEVEEEED